MTGDPMRALVLKACAFRFFDTFLLILPFYTVMFSEHGLKPAQIGFVLSAWSLTTLALEIPAGVLADRTSRRWLLFAGQALRAVGFGVWMIAPGFWGYLVGLSLWGLKSALQSGTFEALVYDELAAMGHAEAYPRLMGRAQAARWAGFLSASLIAAWAVQFGYGLLLGASLAAAAFSAGTAIALPPAPKARATHDHSFIDHMRRGVRDAIRLPGVAPLLLFIAAMQAIVTGFEDYWQLLARLVGLPPPKIALFVAALGGASALGSVLAHRAHRLPLPVLQGLLAVAGLAIVAASALYRPWAVVALIPFVGLIRALDINFDARFQKRLAPETRATVASVKGFMAQSATTLMILGFGLIAQASAYRVSFAVYGAALAVLGVAYALAYARRSR